MQTKLFVLLIVLPTLILTSCASKANESQIATAVALTVEARDANETATATAQANPVRTEAGPPSGESTPTPTPTLPAGAFAPYSGCLEASLLGETIQDGTIMKPGEIFTKNWTVKNTGTCTWDQTYKLVFWGGDLMGGAYVYDFPGYAAPDQVVQIPIVLYAPEQAGKYRGYWRIQSPNGIDFGVGQYNESMWVDVAVSDSETPGYGVTNVTFSQERVPQFGCPANVTYTTYATITVSGPTTVTYQWLKSDNTVERFKPLVFNEAGSQTVKVSWQLNRGVVLKTRWVQLVITSPGYTEFGRQEFFHDCHLE